MIRGAAGVMAGYLVFALSAVLLFQLAGADPHAAVTPAFLVLSGLYGAFFALLAGWTAARVGAGPWPHRIVAGLVALAAAGSLFALGEGESPWSQIATLVVFAPLVLVGGGRGRQGRTETEGSVGRNP